ncbi:MAG: hypothetical protein IJU91_05075, partial [Selenomonadaceae bacterium]|nr:hypothetical protein [Selenomonadaceae bacterium]
KRGMEVTDPNVRNEICEEIDVDLDHDLLPDPDREVIEIALRQIQRLEDRVNQLEKELAAARAEITHEALRTSTLEVTLADEKISAVNLKKNKS